MRDSSELATQAWSKLPAEGSDFEGEPVVRSGVVRPQLLSPLLFSHLLLNSCLQASSPLVSVAQPSRQLHTSIPWAAAQVPNIMHDNSAGRAESSAGRPTPPQRSKKFLNWRFCFCAACASLASSRRSSRCASSSSEGSSCEAMPRSSRACRQSGAAQALGGGS